MSEQSVGSWYCLQGYLARSFLASKEGTAIQSECELRVRHRV
jgi:hypothetical protein